MENGIRNVRPDDASGFVSVAEAVPDVLLDIRYYSTFNFVGKRIDGYEEPLALLTEEAAAALKSVSDRLLPRGFRLKLFDAYRPQKAVDHFMRWAADPADIRMKSFFYPDKDKSALIPEGYIACRSAHSRGSAVDLTLFDMSSGREADMGSPFDFFGIQSHPDYRGISRSQHERRMILRDAMICGGFLPFSGEWWHFTLENEPFPAVFFNFPVSRASLK